MRIQQKTLDMARAWPQPRAKTPTADLLRKHGGKHGTIYSAVRGGDVEAVKDFLAAGADVNAKDSAGGHWKTPLHYAAGHGHKEIAELLITKGADVNAKNKKGKTPLDLAKVESWDSREVKAAKRQIADLLRQVPRKIDLS